MLDYLSVETKTDALTNYWQSIASSNKRALPKGKSPLLEATQIKADKLDGALGTTNTSLGARTDLTKHSRISIKRCMTDFPYCHTTISPLAVCSVKATGPMKSASLRPIVNKCPSEKIKAIE